MNEIIINKIKIVLTPHDKNELSISTYEINEHHADLQHYRGESSFSFNGDVDVLNLYLQQISKAIIGNSSANFESCDIFVEDKGVCLHLLEKVMNALLPVNALIIDKNQKPEEGSPPVPSDMERPWYQELLDSEEIISYDDPYVTDYFDRYD